MPTRQETRTLGGEVDRIDDKLDEYADAVASGDSDDAVSLINQRAKRLDTALTELEALVDEYGTDAEVTMQGLDDIKLSEVGNLTLDASAQASTDSVSKTEELIRAAKALVDAPWIDEDTDSPEAIIEATFSGRKGLRYWILQVENDLSGYAERETKNWYERIAGADSGN